MLHLVFQQTDIYTLQKAIELDETLKGKVIQVEDEFAVGPIENIYTEEGYNNRIEWWKQVLEFSPYTDSINKVDDHKVVEKIISNLRGGEEVWIWVGQNQHDVCGYYWLISQLKDYQRKVFVLYLNNLPFISEKGGLFYPTVLHEIQPKELLKAKRLARAITLSEFEIDPDEWKKLCNENAIVRILEGGKKIVSKDATFYDKDILNAITPEPQKLQKILHNIFSKSKTKTGDVFLIWRVRELIKEGKIIAEGDWNKGWKEITVRLADVSANEENIDVITTLREQN